MDADGEHPFHRLHRNLPQWLEAREHGIVDERSDRRGELTLDALEQREHIVAPADVDLISSRLKSHVSQPTDRRLQPLGTDVDTGQTPTLAAEALRNGKADPARRAG